MFSVTQDKGEKLSEAIRNLTDSIIQMKIIPIPKSDNVTNG